MIRLSVLLLWFGAFAAPAFAQDETIADIRAELAALAADLQALRAELVSSGQAGMQAAGGASALDRMNAMEAEIVRLTSVTEALQNKVDRVVADGTNRIGDLEFRLCELEEGCDISSLPVTATLGGGAPAPGPVTPAPAAPTASQPELAANEQADFDRAKAAYEDGNFQDAADLFAAFTETYTGGPLTGEAHFMRGEALAQTGAISAAARAYLEAFSGQPDGPVAAQSLLRLGQSLGQLGQLQEACVTLAEVGARFPGSASVAEAQATMQNLGCQ